METYRVFKKGKIVKRKVEFKKRLDMWVTAWLALMCTIVAILTFCHYQPKWDLMFWLRDTEK